MQNYLKLLSFLKEHRRLFSVAVILMFFASLFEGVQLSLLVPITDRIFNKREIIVPNELPTFITRIIDNLNAQDPETLFWMLPIMVIAVMFIKHAIIYNYQYLMNEVAQRVMRDVRHKLYHKIQNLSLDYFSEKRTGELISRITHDVQIIENAVSYSVTDLFRQTFMIMMYITISFSIHPKAAILILTLFPLIVLPINLVGKRLRKLSKVVQERMADINSILLETISGIRVVKAFCTEDYEVGRFRDKNQEYYRFKMKTVKRTLFISPMTEIFGALYGVMIILWMGKQVMNEELSIGVFALFFGSIMAVISPIKKLGNVNAITQQALSANDRIYEVLDQQPTVQESPQAEKLATMADEIRLENLNFRYTGEDNQVLRNINLQIKKGQLVAIVGPTGTGKSTLVNLIPRFYDPTQGAVLIDGKDLRSVDFQSLRSQIGIVAQETFLFNDTVKSNIAYGMENANFDQIEEAAKKAYAHQFIMKMPKGYDTIVGDRGFRLSGGEKQRITIARAIFRNPPILILDEATSQLDSESEKYVQEALDQLMQGRTVIAIAHRLSTIKKADKIIVLDQGAIVGEGKHADLLKSCELYARLHKTQFQM